MKKINIIFLIYGLLITTTAFAGNHIAEKSSNRFISENKTSTNQSTVVQKKNNSKVEAVPEISFTFGDGMRGNWGRGWLDIYYSLNYDPKVPFKESDWFCISNEVGDSSLGLNDPANGGGAVNSGNTGWKTLSKLAGKRVTFAFKGFAVGKFNISVSWAKFQVRITNPKTQQTIDLPEITEPVNIIDMSENNSYTWQKINNYWRFANKVSNNQSGKKEYSWCIFKTISFDEITFTEAK